MAPKTGSSKESSWQKTELTKSAVDAAQPQALAIELRGTLVPGFLCKTTPAGRKVAALTTLLGVGAELAAPENRNDGNRVPSLTERPGLPMRIIVNRDLVLRPYQPMFFVRGAPQ